MGITAKRDSAADSRLIAICGNPNSGKTTIFNRITGLNQKVGNYSGVTVEKVSGQFNSSSGLHKYTLVDIPGTYSLAAFSPDEYIAASALYGALDDEKIPDAIICVMDATNLDRSLYLVLQAVQVGRPMVVALNMVDLAERKGIDIDCDRLSEKLGGIPVVPMVGNQGKGIDELKQRVDEIAVRPILPDCQHYDDEVEQLISHLLATAGPGRRTRAEYLRIIFDVQGPAEQKFLHQEADEGTREMLEKGRARLKEKFGSLSTAETRSLTDRAAAICQDVITLSPRGNKSFSERMDTVLLHRVAGPLILIMVMLLVFQSIFTWAEPFMNFIDESFHDLAAIVGASMAEGPLRSLITDGVIGGVGSVLVFIPQIVILFVFISFLEDSGYMARAAFLVDRMFRWCGLSGKSFIPLLSSFACAVPGIMATRTIEDRKLRFITILVAPLMSCSARLPVYTIMIAAFIPYQKVLGLFNLQGLILSLLYVMGVVVAVLVSFVLKKTLFRTEAGTFLMEMPSYKLPTLRSTMVRVTMRVKAFTVRAGTVILAITIIIWALSYFPRSSFADYNYDKGVLQVEDGAESTRLRLNGQLLSLMMTGGSELSGFYDSVVVALNAGESEQQLRQLSGQFTTGTPVRADLVRTVVEMKAIEFRRQAALAQLANKRAGESLANSYFGRIGRFVEPVFEPLGWDWKISMAVLASFPAREVMIATLGTIYNLGSDVDEGSSSLIGKMRQAKRDSGNRIGENVFNPAVALSIVVFFALCCQCGATLVTIKNETTRWIYPVATFTYMTVLAYGMAAVVYNISVWSGLG
jgi:ferrous iron transport protein B